MSGPTCVVCYGECQELYALTPLCRECYQAEKRRLDKLSASAPPIPPEANQPSGAAQ